MSDKRVDRVRLALTVDKDIREQFERAIIAKHGAKQPYAGVELEREMKNVLGMGKISELTDCVAALAEEFGEIPGENKYLRPERGETVIVQYRVRQDVRERFMREAKQHERFRSAGEFIELLMKGYVDNRSTIEKATDRMGRVIDAAKRELDEKKGVKQRRAESIAAVLRDSGGTAFDLEDFDDAVDTAAAKINSSKYARKTYLPLVIDELGYEWHPNGFFTDPESLDIPDTYNPAEKPYCLLSEADKRVAVKYTGLREAQSRPTSRTQMDVADVKDALNGKPNADTARAIMRNVADSRGIMFDSKDTVLKIDAEAAATDPDSENTSILRQLERAGDAPVADNDARGSGSMSEDRDRTDAPETGERPSWVAEAVEQVPSKVRDDPPAAVVDNKIARAKWPEEIEENEITQDAVDRVTDRQRQIVFNELADSTNIEADADNKLEQIMNAEPIKPTTDGGSQVDEN